MQFLHENPENKQINWILTEVNSKLIDHPVSVIAAKNLRYIANANRFQTFNIYLPNTPETLKYVNTPVSDIPDLATPSNLPKFCVHIHGGAWRDPQLTADSIEATVAHAFLSAGESECSMAFISMNYTISQFPEHPNFPYSAIKDNHTDIRAKPFIPSISATCCTV